LPIAGTYTVVYGSQTLTFNVGDQSSVASNLVLAVPTVTVANGIVQRVNWSYRLGSGDAALDPAALMQLVEASFWPNASGAPAFGNGCTDSGNLAAGATQFVPQCQTPLNWADIFKVEIRYRDLYGNDVIVGWPMQPGF
jgi:hypothetical protein